MTCSNCFAHAARWFAAGPNGYLLLRLSRLAGWQWHAPRPVWALAGAALYWPAVALLNLWALACTGRTLHATYAEHQTGRCREFVPADPQRRISPPWWFRGRVREFVLTAPAPSSPRKPRPDAPGRVTILEM